MQQSGQLPIAGSNSEYQTINDGEISQQGNNDRRVNQKIKIWGLIIILLILAIALLLFDAYQVSKFEDNQNQLIANLIDHENIHHQKVPKTKEETTPLVDKFKDTITGQFDSVSNQLPVTPQELRQKLKNIPLSNQIDTKNLVLSSKGSQAASTEKYSTPFPKILWLGVYRNASVLTTYQAIMKNAMKHFGEKSGYEVHVVDVWSSYDYLSDEYINKITKSMQTKKVDINVDELLRLAILIQNGGVYVEVTDYTLIEGLQWIDEIFQGKGGQLSKKYKCSGLKYPELFIFEQNESQIFPKTFKRQLFAARKNSKFLKELFQQMLRMIRTGFWQYQHLNKIKFTNEWTGAHYFQNLLENTIISKLVMKELQLGFSSCNYYKLQSLNYRKDFQQLAPPCNRDDPQFYFKDLDNYQIKQCLKTRFWMRPTYKIIDFIIDVMKKQSLQPVHPNSFIAKILFQGDNKQFLVKKPQTKSVHMCVVSLKVVPKDDQKSIKKSLGQLKKQTFQNWTAVYLVEGDKAQSNTISETRKYWVVPSTGNQGLDAQKAYVNYCPNDSIIFLLSYDERLSGRQSLQLVGRELKIPGIFGAFIPLEFNNDKTIPNYYKNFNRLKYYLKSKVDKAALNDVLNHFRVFQSRLYRLIPKFDIHRLNGTYYEDRLLYLIIMLEMAEEVKIQDRNFYDYEIANREYPLPKDYKIVSGVSILTNGFESYNEGQLKQLSYKFPGFSIGQSLNYYNDFGVPFSKFYVFNDGKEPSIGDKRKGMPQLIPKIIHQIWIKGQLPPMKAYLSKRTQQLYPSYEYKIWKQQNLTFENFPRTFPIINRLLQFQNSSTFSKFAMVADIMRGQFLYEQGGFYFDFNLEFFRNVFDQWLTYKLVMPAEVPLRNRASGQICFMGVMPKLKPLLRIIGYRNTNQYEIYSEKADQKTGPTNYHKLVWGNEEQDPDYFFIPYEFMFPAAANNQVHEDLCLVDSMYPRAVAVEKGKGLLPNCGDLYPLQIASEHYGMGGSWNVRKK